MGGHAHVQCWRHIRLPERDLSGHYNLSVVRMRSSDVTSGWQNGTYRDTTILTVLHMCRCDVTIRIKWSGYNIWWSGYNNFAHACAGVTWLDYRDTMIGVQIGTHDLFYVWTCQSIMSLLECTIRINWDTGFAHVRFSK